MALIFYNKKILFVKINIFNNILKNNNILTSSYERNSTKNLKNIEYIKEFFK